MMEGECCCGNDDIDQFTQYNHGNDVIGALCQKCHTEWLLPQYIIDYCEQLQIFGHTLYRREIESVTSYRVGTSKILISNVRRAAGSLTIGDHISWHRDYILYHHAIVVSFKSDETINVIHFTKSNGMRRPQIKPDTLDLTRQNGALYRLDYPNDVREENPFELVIARAQALSGEEGYCLLDNNCEDIATFCKVGVKGSRQSKWLCSRFNKSFYATLGQLGSFFIRGMYKIPVVLKTMEGKATNLAFNEEFEDFFHAHACFGPVIVAGFELLLCIFDVIRIYRKRGDNFNFNYKQKICQRVFEALFASIFCIGLGVCGQLAGIEIGRLLALAQKDSVMQSLNRFLPAIVLAVVVKYTGIIMPFFGAISLGLLGNISGTILGTFLGQHIWRVSDKCRTRRVENDNNESSEPNERTRLIPSDR